MESKTTKEGVILPQIHSLKNTNALSIETTLLYLSSSPLCSHRACTKRAINQGRKVGTIRGFRITDIFAYSFQSSIRASRGTVGGYFLAGRSMTWWPVSWTFSLLSQHIFQVLAICDLFSAFFFFARISSAPSYCFAQFQIPLLLQSI